MGRKARGGDVRIAIVGAGLGGIATAVMLKRAGYTRFTVFEKAAGPGGVWWQNTYPGCEVDVPSLAYSFSFMPYDWSRTHAGQPEMLHYINDVIDRFDVRNHLQFDTEVQSVQWDDDAKNYHLVTGCGGSHRFDFVVSCVGMLSDPNLPDWEGIDTFTGPVFHTSSYDHGQDLRGRRVAIVGTGSTACQLTPALAPVVGSLDLYQREPGYVLPKRVREIDADQHSRHRRYPILRRIDRFKLFMRASNDGKAIRAESRRQRELRQYCLRYIADTLADEGVRAAVTPSYAFGCKRPVLASGFYASLNEPHVNLVPHEVVQVTPKGLIDSTGAHREAEVLILATGFRPTQYLSTLDVRGRGGQSLQEVWNGEPSAFLGVTVPGFPNFFILYGPNTNGGSSVIAQLEIQAELVVRTIRRMGRSRANVVDTRSGTARRFDSWVQGQIRERLSALTTGCHNYYHTSTGKNVTQWPHSHLVYRALSLLLPYWGHVKKAEPSDGEAKSRAPNESTAPASAPDYRSASQLDSDRRTA